MQKIYQDYKGNHVVFVQPGMHHKELPEWFSSENKPLLFEIKFVNGMAIVEDPIAKYMIERGMARATRIITNNIKFSKMKNNEQIPGENEILFNCPDCGHVQSEPGEQTNYLCGNFECRRDFIARPVTESESITH